MVKFGRLLGTDSTLPLLGGEEEDGGSNGEGVGVAERGAGVCVGVGVGVETGVGVGSTRGALGVLPSGEGSAAGGLVLGEGVGSIRIVDGGGALLPPRGSRSGGSGLAGVSKGLGKRGSSFGSGTGVVADGKGVVGIGSVGSALAGSIGLIPGEAGPPPFAGGRSGRTEVGGVVVVGSIGLGFSEVDAETGGIGAVGKGRTAAFGSAWEGGSKG